MEDINLESYAAVQADHLTELYREEEISRTRLEEYIDKVEKAALATYTDREIDIDREDLTVDSDIFDGHPPALEAGRDKSRQQAFGDLVTYVEDCVVDDWEFDGVLATRPSGVGPAAYLADRFDMDYSVAVFHGYGGRDQLPADAHNIHEVEYRGPFTSNAWVEVIGEYPETQKIVVAGDRWGDSAGEADAVLDFTADAESIQRRIMDESWNVPATTRFSRWMENLKR